MVGQWILAVETLYIAYIDKTLSYPAMIRSYVTPNETSMNTAWFAEDECPVFAGGVSSRRESLKKVLCCKVKIGLGDMGGARPGSRDHRENLLSMECYIRP